MPGGSPTDATTGQLLETARLFALAGTAMVNASIVAWQGKYFSPTGKPPVRLWRPETAIRRATEDGNPSTVAEATWQPLSAQQSGTRFSPNFPAYVSGHSTFGAAWAAAMHDFFGTNAVAFTATTEDPHALRDENGVRRTRSFASFTQAALENGRSRVYLGVHYQFDANGGFEIGTKVGEDTAQCFGKLPAGSEP
ncbi:MAG: vanadium-dependent haloperoxidase [Hymenobacter sp.]